MNRLVLCTSCILLPAGALSAQTWTEAGEAGNLPGTAQVAAGAGALTQIDGSIDDPTLTDPSGDSDAYLIHIDDPVTFRATTIGGSSLDTQLFLFDANGFGVAHNDDDPGGGTLLSTVTGQFVTAPGLYLIAVSTYNVDPEALGQFIWANSPFAAERQPDGPGAADAVDNWVGSGFSGTGTYSIFLTGASLVTVSSSCSDLTVSGNGEPGTNLDFALSGADAGALAALAIGDAGSTSFGLGALGTLELGLDPGFLVRIMGFTNGNGAASTSLFVPPGLPFEVDLSAQAVTAALSLAPPGPPSLAFCTSDVEAFHVGN